MFSLQTQCEDKFPPSSYVKKDANDNSTADRSTRYCGAAVCV